MLQVLLLIFGLVCGVNSRNSTLALEVLNGGQWGEWGHAEYCPEGEFVVGYQMKVEEKQYFSDDTSLNAIRLICAEGRTESETMITSATGQWGEWSHSVSCNHYPGAGFYVVSFALAVEEPQGNGDDTAANWIKLMCRDASSETEDILPEEEINVHPGHGFYGQFGNWSDTCYEGDAVCGIQTRVEAPQGDADDTALNDVRLLCCEVPEETAIYLDQLVG